MKTKGSHIPKKSWQSEEPGTTEVPCPICKTTFQWTAGQERMSRDVEDYTPVCPSCLAEYRQENLHAQA
jgi:hypothetical protein